MAERKRIHIVPVGDWKGHPAGEQHYGPAELQFMVDRANKVVSESGNPLQIDYEHASLNPPADGAPAAGWMYSFTLEDDGIFADVEWTPKAKEYIGNGEYKYISPVISGPFPDPVTGEQVPIELFNAALTNQPFMHDRIQQVVASAITSAHGDGAQWYTNTKQITISNNQGGNMADLQETVNNIVAALPGAGSPEDVMNFLKKASEVLAIMPGAPEGGGMPTEEGMGEMMEATKQAMANSRQLTDVAALLKCKPDEVMANVSALRSNSGNATELAEKVKQLEARQLEADAAALIENNATKIAPADREFWLNYAKTNGTEATKAVFSKMPEILPGKNVRPAENQNTGEVSEEYIAFTLKANPGMKRERAIELYKNRHSKKEA